MRALRTYRGVDKTLLAQGRSRAPLPVCEETGCFETTCESKPFCLKHVWKNKAALAISAELEAMRNEERRARLRGGWKKINTKGARCLDILELVNREGEVSIKKLAFDFELDMTAAEAYVTALVQAGKIAVQHDHYPGKSWLPRTMISLADKVE